MTAIEMGEWENPMQATTLRAMRRLWRLILAAFGDEAEWTRQTDRMNALRAWAQLRWGGDVLLRLMAYSRPY